MSQEDELNNTDEIFIKIINKYDINERIRNIIKQYKHMDEFFNPISPSSYLNIDINLNIDDFFKEITRYEVDIITVYSSLMNIFCEIGYLNHFKYCCEVLNNNILNNKCCISNDVNQILQTIGIINISMALYTADMNNHQEIIKWFYSIENILPKNYKKDVTINIFRENKKFIINYTRFFDSLVAVSILLIALEEQNALITRNIFEEHTICITDISYLNKSTLHLVLGLSKKEYEFIEAALLNKQHIVKHLLKKGIKYNMLNDYVFRCVCKKKYINIIKLLMAECPSYCIKVPNPKIGIIIPYKLLYKQDI